MQKSTYNPTPADAQAQPGRRRKNRSALWVGLAALVVIIPLTCICMAIILFQVLEWNLPGVTVYDKDVNLMSYEETITWVDSYWNQDRLIQLVSSENPEDSYWLKPADLGIWVNPEETADDAFSIGRSADPFGELLTAASGEKQTIYPTLYFNDTLARETLAEISNEISIPAVEAEIIYENGAWAALPGSSGRIVDIETTLDGFFKNAFLILLSQSATLQVNTVTPELSDLTPVLDDIDAVVAPELGFQAYDPITDEHFAWFVPIETRRTWVAVDPQSYEVRLSPDPDDVANLLEGWEADLGQGRSWEDALEPEDLIDTWAEGGTSLAIVRHDPTTYHVGPGESLWYISLKVGIPMWHIMEANQGLTASNLEAGMDLVIPSKNVLLPLPVIPEKRIVIDISEQRMTVYENGQVWASYIVSTGVSDSPTMVGIFQVQSHELNAYASNWDLYMPHFMGIYEAWPGFMNGIHGLPLLSNGQRLWASALGSPASYGCIILNLDAAEDLYYWADAGVVVEITD